MILFDKHDLGVFRPMQNFVLTTSVFREDVIKLGDKELYQDTTFNPGFHQPICQRVVKTPKNLTFGKWTKYIELDKGYDPVINANRKETVQITPPIPYSMPWQTTMDLKRDDTVYCDSLSLAMAEKDNRLIMCEGVKYFLVRYEDIYFRLVKGLPQMINGWILVEPIANPQSEVMTALSKSGFVFPGVTVTAQNRRELDAGDKLGIVRHIGIPVTEYLDELEEHDHVSVGDTVIFKWSANRRLEAGGSRFFGKTELIVTRRPRLVGKMTEELF